MGLFHSLLLFQSHSNLEPDPGHKPTLSSVSMQRKKAGDKITCSGKDLEEWRKIKKHKWILNEHLAMTDQRWLLVLGDTGSWGFFPSFWLREPLGWESVLAWERTPVPWDLHSVWGKGNSPVGLSLACLLPSTSVNCAEEEVKEMWEKPQEGQQAPLALFQPLATPCRPWPDSESPQEGRWEATAGRSGGSREAQAAPDAHGSH